MEKNDENAAAIRDIAYPECGVNGSFAGMPCTPMTVRQHLRKMHPGYTEEPPSDAPRCDIYGATKDHKGRPFSDPAQVVHHRRAAHGGTPNHEARRNGSARTCGAVAAPLVKEHLADVAKQSTHRGAAILLALALGACLFAPQSSRALDLHVAPEGNDRWSGVEVRPNADRTDGPLASLTGARDVIRKRKAAGAVSEPIRVLVEGGHYELRETLKLDPSDSGSEQAPISYEAVPGAKPVFSGGKVIGGWKPAANGLWIAQVPEVAEGKWYFEQLWVNGRRATRARTPNRFCHYMRDVEEESLVSGAGNQPSRARQIVRLRDEDWKALTGLTPAELKGVNLVVYHNWDNTRRFIDSIDEGDRCLVTSGKAMKPWNQWKRDSQFVLENALRYLDEPGEWFLSRDGSLYYQPLPGEEMTHAEVVAPILPRFIAFEGDPAAGKFVEHLSFKGLSFQHGQCLTPSNGFEPIQAAASVEATIMADGARHVQFEDCEISHVGTYALWFRKGCANDTLQHCAIEDFGAGGVRIGETDIRSTQADRTSRVTVENNIIRNGGCIFPCAVGVWIGQSGENLVTHNEIADLFYTGISVGWTWGYGESVAKKNVISFNHIHHLGKGLLSDMAGIYTLGLSKGTVVRGNSIHDIRSYSYGGWGMYTDEGSTGILLEDNLVYNTKTGSFYQHYGSENIVRNNILANSKENQLQSRLAEDHLSFTFERNIVYWSNSSPLLKGKWKEGRQLSRNNLYWNSAGNSVTFEGKPLAEWQNTPVLPPSKTAATPPWAVPGRELGSIIADPLFVDPASNDFHLQPDSPALKIGFQPFDYTQAGVCGDPKWIAKAKAVQYPQQEIAPEPSQAAIELNFERDPPGKPPRGLNLRGDADAILVTAETAATGKQSLKITDAPGLKTSWRPHLNLSLNYREGQLRNEFDLRLEEGAHVGFEWRDIAEGQYHTGASLSIIAGKLRVAGRTLDLPLHQWIHFELTAGLGKADKQTWRLRVTIPGQPPHAFESLEYADRQFKKLNWIGFMSNAQSKAVYYLDNIRLSIQ